MASTIAEPGPDRRVSLPVDNAVEELLLWRHPAKSGAVLGVATILYLYLTFVTNHSVISLVSLSLLIFIFAAAVWAVLARFLNRPGPPIPKLLREGVSEGQLKALVDEYTPYINKGLAILYRLASGKDLILSAEVIIGLFVVSKLGNVFSVTSWIFFAVFLAFTVPKIYELKKPEIDSFAASKYDQTKQLYDQHVAPQVAKIPRGSTASTPAKKSY